MNNIKGIIFDLDGVICHTDRYHFLAWKTIADKLEISFDEHINNQLRGVSRMESLEIILKNAQIFLTDNEKLELAYEKNEIYREKLCEMSAEDIEESVRETLILLKQREFKLAIGSSSKNARFILDKTDCTKYFDVICDGNDITNSKPHPEVFSLAGKRLQLMPSQCAVVEDAVAGIKAAIAAGMMPIAMGDAALSDIGVYTISNVYELLSLL